MRTRTVVEVPGYVTVAVAADRLRLAPRSVRDLVYAGRMPSARLGRRHLLRVPDVEAERRRRLGLPLPAPRPAARRRRVLRERPDGPPAAPRGEPAAVQPRAASPSGSATRRERAQRRAEQLERWLRGHGPSTPRLPFTALDLGAESAACDACQRPVRAGGRMVEAGAADGRPAARLCLTCARRALLEWSDGRR